MEALFGVSRRNAHYLLGRFGAQRLGNALVIERDTLAQALVSLQSDDEVTLQLRRHHRVRVALQQRRASLHLARISLPQPTVGALSQLPPSIQLAPGHLTIQFSGAIDLLTQLTELSKAIAEDFDTFEHLLN